MRASRAWRYLVALRCVRPELVEGPALAPRLRQAQPERAYSDHPELVEGQAQPERGLIYFHQNYKHFILNLMNDWVNNITGFYNNPRVCYELNFPHD